MQQQARPCANCILHACLLERSEIRNCTRAPQPACLHGLQPQPNKQRSLTASRTPRSNSDQLSSIRSAHRDTQAFARTSLPGFPVSCPRLVGLMTASARLPALSAHLLQPSVHQLGLLVLPGQLYEQVGRAVHVDESPEQVLLQHKLAWGWTRGQGKGSESAVWLTVMRCGATATPATALNRSSSRASSPGEESAGAVGANEEANRVRDYGGALR